MKTLKDFDNDTGSARTAWTYSPRRGWLNDKLYPDSQHGYTFDNLTDNATSPPNYILTSMTTWDNQSDTATTTGWERDAYGTNGYKSTCGY